MTTATARRIRRRPGWKPQDRQAATAQRVQEPDAEMLDEVYRDESVEIINRAKAALGEEVCKGMAFIYGSAKVPIDHYVKRGYTPVVVKNEKGENEQVHDRGDPLLMVDKKKEQRRLAAPGVLAATQLAETMQGESDKYGVVDRDGQRHAPEMTEE